MKHIQGSKPTKYNGVLYKSKLEAEFAKILDDNNIKFEYEKQSFQLLPTVRYNGETIIGRKYTPDFFLENNIIIEAKGRPDNKWPYRKLLFIINFILNNDYKYEFYEIHTKTQLLKFIKELKARKGKRLEPSQVNIGTKRTKKDGDKKKRIKKHSMEYL